VKTPSLISVAVTPCEVELAGVPGLQTFFRVPKSAWEAAAEALPAVAVAVLLAVVLFEREAQPAIASVVTSTPTDRHLRRLIRLIRTLS
jgi:hypothetical protein